MCCGSRRGCRSSRGSRSVSPCWASISWAMVCATRWTSEHDRHRVPPDSLARPARPVPRAARRGVPVDRGHRLPEQRQHRTHPGAHAPRPGRIHREADGPAPAPGPRAPGGTAGGAARRGPAPQCRARRDRARDQHQSRPEPRRPRVAPAARRRGLISVLEPAVAGWMAFEGTDDFSRLTEYNPTFRSDARRFEMVTLPYQDFYGMTASVGMLAELGIDDIAQYARTLHEPVCRWADETGVRVVSPRAEAHRSAIICLAPAHPVGAYHALKRAHVVCSLREGAIRLAPHCYNTVEELERVLDVLDQLE